MSQGQKWDVRRTSRRGIGTGRVTATYDTETEAQTDAEFMNHQNSRHQDRDDVLYVVELRAPEPEPVA
ncbi:MAG: hypothetical protein HC933_16345 [Pleurocapsa sp. SU_196_0]|nr:hypothetical protein [Pleurocapsa sp. SU_196_0]